MGPQTIPHQPMTKSNIKRWMTIPVAQQIVETDKIIYLATTYGLSYTYYLLI